MRNNFTKLLDNKVEIPIIQRDFAQGRTDEKTAKVRKDFLDVLFDTILKKSTNPEAYIELDFIYGSLKHQKVDEANKVFLPIDGQQRLTTLWLMYWFVASKEVVTSEDKSFLSNFIYETRHSTSQFCRELIRFSPQFVDGNLSKEIKNQSWYFETWDYDPSIQAMLVMLDDIESRYNLMNHSNIWSIISDQSCPFYFYKLDMKDVGLTDDLYIKMNSRGKALTEFEYFKASFTDFITDSELRNRFTKSIDGQWSDSLWHLVLNSGKLKPTDDIALFVDNAFLNLFNFITSVLNYKTEKETPTKYIDTVKSSELLKMIYTHHDNLVFLFETFDAVCLSIEQDPAFWEDHFYTNKEDFELNKSRFYFQHSETNLLSRCLFHFADTRGFSFPEQLILWACLTHFKSKQQNFHVLIRRVRSIVINSENELRDTSLGKSFAEIEKFILSGDLNYVRTFKTDQIDEEKKKEEYSSLFGDEELIAQLEDSELFRGSISLFTLDENFTSRGLKFLKLFDEDDFVQHFPEKVNLLLCFGDYSQMDGSTSNFMAANKPRIRSFLTSPGYNKVDFNQKTKKIVMDCLDYFIEHDLANSNQKIVDSLALYEVNQKDWRYYFMKYRSFRENCQYGYYFWIDNQYLLWKMNRKQFNGFNWDPFLYEIAHKRNLSYTSLPDYEGRLEVKISDQLISIFSIPNGFHFDVSDPILFENLKNKGILNDIGQLVIKQDAEGVDLEDRINKLYYVLYDLLKN